VVAAVKAHTGADLAATGGLLHLVVLEPQGEARAVLGVDLGEITAGRQRTP
jgi:hypothetical protein